MSAVPSQPRESCNATARAKAVTHQTHFTPGHTASPGLDGFVWFRPTLKKNQHCMHAQLCLTLCDPLTEPARLLCLRDFPGKNTGVGCHFLLQYETLPKSRRGMNSSQFIIWGQHYPDTKTRQKSLQENKRFPSPGDLPDPGIKHGSPTLWANYCLSHQGSPTRKHYNKLISLTNTDANIFNKILEK